MNLRYAIRALRSNPGFAAVAILSLALGIGANTAIFSLIDSVMLKTLPVSHPEQLLQVTIAVKTVISPTRSGSSFAIARTCSPESSLTAADASIWRPAARRAMRKATSCPASFSTPWACAPLLGRTLHRGRRSARLPGNRRPQLRFLAEGVRRPRRRRRARPSRSTIIPSKSWACSSPDSTGVDVGSESDLYVPLCAEKIIRGENSILDERSAWWLRVIGRPKPGISASQAEARLRTLAPAIFEATLPPNWKPEDQR